jgi:hypothetical protein
MLTKFDGTWKKLKYKKEKIGETRCVSVDV